MTTSDLDSLIETISQIGNNKREVLITLSTDEFREINGQLSDYIRKGDPYSSKNLKGIGGNIHSYTKLGITLHLKIDTDL